MYIYLFVYAYSQICRLLGMTKSILMIFPAGIKNRTARQLQEDWRDFRSGFTDKRFIHLGYLFNYIESTSCQQSHRRSQIFPIYCSSKLHNRLGRYTWNAIFVTSVITTADDSVLSISNAWTDLHRSILQEQKRVL